MILRAACILTLLGAAGASAADNDTAAPIRDEPLRVAALRAIFSGMQVSVVPSKKIDDSWPKKPRPGELYFPDALAGETVYRVVGRAMNQMEDCASSNVAEPEKSSSTRQVRFRLFWWPKENGAGLLAALQYKFPAANPAMACPSMAILVHLVKKDAGWHQRNGYLFETTHHDAVQRIELVDLAGGGTADHLVIESDFGGGGGRASSLQVFELRQGRFDEALSKESRMEFGDHVYTDTLDIARTRQTHSQQFCTSKTTMLERGERIDPPRTTKPCYRSGDGVNRAVVTERNKGLAPMRQ